VAPSDAQLAERSARERILDAACELIAQRGTGGARIAQIARTAGVSTALVHYHFRTREALLAEALDHAFDVASAARARPPDQVDRGSAVRRLAGVVERSLPATEPGRREWQLLVEMWLGAARDPSLRPIVARMYVRHRTWIAAAVADGIAAGEFADVDPNATADVAIALIDGLGLRVLTRDPSMPPARTRELIGGVLAQVLRIPAGRLPFAAAAGAPAQAERRGERSGR
jgi:AcrR family transcriptional regulator